MQNEENENTLYARWLNKELSDQEYAELQKKGDDKVLSKIIETVDAWSLPSISENHKQEIDRRIATKQKKKIIPFYKQTWFYAAASVVVLLGIFFLIKEDEKNEPKLARIECLPGSTKTITLADNTVMIMNGQSYVEYDSVSWSTNRQVNMEGNVYFDVRTKGAFTVNYNDGKVSVLGTKFNVQHKNRFTSVKCFEGKVQVELGKLSFAINPGEGVRSSKGIPSKFKFNPVNVKPLSALTTFENSPLEEVCNALSIHYGLEFKGNGVDFSRNFTGIYKNTSVDTALMMVFEPMGISYTRKGTTVFLENK
ncbi:MAG TPA: FecR family protein [Flavobacteriales bacterium]|nr:FecR family protein [Flavobacteriales bacterium]